MTLPPGALADLDQQLALLIALAQNIRNDLAGGIYDPDTVMLARAIQGENVGVFAERDELARYLAHVAFNRYTKPWWSKTPDGTLRTLAQVVEEAFHGVVNVKDPDPWALGIAYAVILTRRAGGWDRADGCLFMLSLEDIEAHGWQVKADNAVVRKFTASNGAELWFFRDWIGD